VSYYPSDWLEEHDIPAEDQKRIDNMTLDEALDEVLAAAQLWDNEVSEWIFPAEDDPETQEGYVVAQLRRDKAFELFIEFCKARKEKA
jgi:hypothetical protein